MQKFIASLFVAAALMFSASAVFAASGASLFSSEGCIACHTINGKGGTVGPNLSHVGSQRNLSWIKTQIITPSAHFASGRMVTINGKSYIAIMPNHKDMPASQVNALAEYLESFK
ncbi:MAG: cytochrome c [Deltaproteobacteria bacterium]|nr:cytochrome c [Deltaproteobacteria bacterium]